MSKAIEAAQNVLRRTFGHDAFRPGQAEIIEALVSGRDTLAVMPTGAGKSLCFQIPALVIDGLTVVVSPLVALMEDQVQALRLAGVPVETINSSRDRETNVAAWRRVAAGEVSMLYLSPERLMTERMQTALARLEPVMFAIDEAHCISRWGAAFRPEYEALCELKQNFPESRIAAFTATADAITCEDIASKLFSEQPKIFIAGFDRPNITIGAEARTDWRLQLGAFLRPRRQESGIIYALSRRQVDEIADHLRAEGFNALPYHAGMDAQDRANHQDRFMTEDPVIMVATIAFGMGIDKPDIRFVVHTHLPANVEAYYQEIGRAGRDGDAAEALLLYGFEDIRMRRKFIDDEGGSDDHRRREHKRLDALVAFAEASSCRRVMLLSYFGEQTTPCGNCDCCLDPPVMVEATRPAQMALSAVARTGQRFGAGHIIDVLRGSENHRVKELGHNNLPTHGVGQSQTKAWWQAFLRQLVSAGHLEIDIQGFGGLKITRSGEEILRGVAAFECREAFEPPKSNINARQRSKTPAQDLSEADQELLGRLKGLRLRLAQDRGVPAYVVLHDRTLSAMAQQRPDTMEAFLALPGVGEKKAQTFGTAFLSLLNEETTDA